MASMASASAAVQPQPAPVVGNAFVSQYYNVLHQSPHVVHRFYTDDSKLTRADQGSVETISTQHDIHQKITSMEYSGFKAEIKTVDSQDSLRGGVLVMVTGTLSSKSIGKRNFVQTFFLAPQEKGYFVLNDALRYLDDESEVAHAGFAMANGVPDASVPESEHREAIGSDEGYVLAEREEEPEHDEEVVESVPAAPEAAPVVEERPQQPAVMAAPEVSPPPEPQGETPKKSYASILLTKDHPAPVRSVPVKTVTISAQTPVTAQPPRATPAASPQETPEEHEGEIDKRAVYVKNLPLNVAESELEAEFKKFGLIKPGGVQIRTYKQQGYCYAFVKFEDAQSAQNAIEGTGLLISGRPVYIEERKTTGTGGGPGIRGGRGGPYAGRGEARGRGGRGAEGRSGGGRGATGYGRGDREGGRSGYYGNNNNNSAAAAAGSTPSEAANNAATSDDGFRQRPQRRGGNRNGAGRLAPSTE